MLYFRHPMLDLLFAYGTVWPPIPSHTHTFTQLAYSEATGGFTEGSTPRDRGTSLGRDDRIHGSLLIINELIMNSMWSDEVG